MNRRAFLTTLLVTPLLGRVRAPAIAICPTSGPGYLTGRILEPQVFMWMNEGGPIELYRCTDETWR